MKRNLIRLPLNRLIETPEKRTRRSNRIKNNLVTDKMRRMTDKIGRITIVLQKKKSG